MFSRGTYKHLLTYTVVVIWVMMILHLIAMKFYLYWTLGWFDIVMHGIGGVTVGFFVGAMLVRFTSIVRHHKKLFLFAVVALTLFIGFLWEGLEFVLDMFSRSSLHQVSVADTMLDLTMDTLGGVAAGILSLIAYKKYGTEQ